MHGNGKVDICRLLKSYNDEGLIAAMRIMIISGLRSDAMKSIISISCRQCQRAEERHFVVVVIVVVVSLRRRGLALSSSSRLVNVVPFSQRHLVLSSLLF